MKHIIFSTVIFLCAFSVSAKVDTIEVKSGYIDSPMRVTVVSPDKQSAERYSSVYLLNGFGGDYRSWCLTRPNLDSLATEYGMIFICPDGRDSWYWDSPENPKMQMESFIIKDLVPFIDNTYPTIADAQHRAVTGLSMGGHGGLWLGIRHPDIFGSAGSTSGNVNITLYPENWKLKLLLGSYEEYPQRWDEHAIIKLVPELEPGQLNIIFDCGIDDQFATINEELHQALLEKGIPHDYISRPGNHSHAYWKNSILYHLLYFYEIFNKSK